MSLIESSNNYVTGRIEKRQITSIEHVVYVINLLLIFHVHSLGFTSQNIDMSWFDSRQGLEIFLSSKVPRSVMGSAQHSLQWASGAPSHRRKKMQRKPDYSPPSNTEFKNAWSHASTPPHAFMVCILLIDGFYNLNATISITVQPTSTILHQMSPFTNSMKTEQYSYFPKTRGFRFRECTSPSLNDKAGKTYVVYANRWKAPATSKLQAQHFFPG